MTKAKVGLARITLDLPLSLQRKLKSAAGLEGRYMRDIMIELLDIYLNKTKSTSPGSAKRE
jgi:hypothetical protein